MQQPHTPHCAPRMIPQEGQILALKHCSPNSTIFCLRLPTACPICKKAFEGENSRREARVLPSPLKSAGNSSCALAIRPSKGHFLTDYHNSCDLHICLSTSDGRIVEFDQKGVRIGVATEHWSSCLIIRLFEQITRETAQLWDSRLEQFSENEQWHAAAYDAKSNNCFDFVLEFLRSLDIESFRSCMESKTKFCEKYIVPKTRMLARYISLYRKVQAEETVTLEGCK